MLERIVIRSYEVGLKFREGEFKGLVGAGTHWIFDPLNKLRVREVRVEIVDSRDVRFEHKDLKATVHAAEAARLLDI